MLQLLSDLPPHVVAAKASGIVTKSDFDDVLIPAFKNAAGTYGEIYFLLLIDNEISNFTWSTWWKEFKSGIDCFTKWKKIALVTDCSAVDSFSNLFRVFTPASSKGFQSQELEEAKNWISKR